jgi:5S rRNA maturation endonuclease (ribonuclease M5)
MAMSNSISRGDYIKEVSLLHWAAINKKDRTTKTTLLDTATVFTGYSRKYLIKKLKGAPKTHPTGFASKDNKDTRGRKPAYNDPDFISALTICWKATNYSCAENLQPYLKILVPRLEAFGELRLSDATRSLLLLASISTVARRLDKQRRRDRIPLGTTKAGNLLKSQVLVRKGRWEESDPGWLETDTVAHGGDSAKGQYIHSYNFVDIATSWSEQVACMGMGQKATVAGINIIRGRLPVPILGIDCDNGGEFINWHLHRYCKTNNIAFTRSRPYKSNDNAHVEQKNDTAIRRILGYARYDTSEQLEIMNQLYSGPLRLFMNYCRTTRKRKFKYINIATGKVKKTYYDTSTPYDRMMKHPKVDKATKQLLQSQYHQLNPVRLLAEVRSLIEQLERTLR